MFYTIAESEDRKEVETMDEQTENQLGDIYFEMRGLASTLLAASRGDLQGPERVVEYAAGQVDRLAGEIADIISGDTEKTAS